MNTQSENTSDRLKPWTLTQLALEMRNDLARCASESERVNCKAVCVSEMRDLANGIRMNRKLTPGEQAICEEYGI